MSLLPLSHLNHRTLSTLSSFPSPPTLTISDEPTKGAHVLKLLNEPDFKSENISYLTYKPNTIYLINETLTIYTIPPRTSSLSLLPKFPKLSQSSYYISGVEGCDDITMMSLMLGQYTYSAPFTSPKPPINLTVPSKINQSIQSLVSTIYSCKTLITSPPNLLNPDTFESHAKEILKGDWSVIKGEQLLDKGYECIHAVGRSSQYEPRLMTYSNPGSGPKFTIIGKAVTFDSGGLSLKPSSGMINMKKDMAGGAIALSLGKLLKEAGIYFELILPVVENSVSGESYRLGDVLRHNNGKTTEILNTDAEGRLILADALLHSSNDTEYIIDFATLTGAARVALGIEVGMFFTNNDDLGNLMVEKGSSVEDPLWRMPLYSGYENRLKGRVSDLTNVTRDGGLGGAITAALYLQNFVPEGKKWVHFDVNGMDENGEGEANGLRACWEVIKGIVEKEK
ncbi:hypothetical protein TrLO_g7893 [Triparma laevis f. longispina]|uniref:Cytosol aminopeptidase domain-containing protein n=1 Tax=Triparma laevis f. longispina TaxID=1714387 RepID=A0A9W7L048_9STRA|nr:hypothetical protein TrLO_g7893 [Triparma laevis f. longispina]